MPPRTLFEKVWDTHVVTAPDGQSPLLYIDLHLVHEVTSPQAFDGLRANGRRVRQPLRTVATVDHNVPTTPRGLPIADPIAARQIEALQKNCCEFGVPLLDMDSAEQGIVHVIGPELGITLPGLDVGVLSLRDLLSRRAHLGDLAGNSAVEHSFLDGIGTRGWETHLGLDPVWTSLGSGGVDDSIGADRVAVPRDMDLLPMLVVLAVFAMVGSRTLTSSGEPDR
jgi:hypothetical protein